MIELSRVVVFSQTKHDQWDRTSTSLLYQITSRRAYVRSQTKTDQWDRAGYVLALSNYLAAMNYGGICQYCGENAPRFVGM